MSRHLPINNNDDKQIRNSSDINPNFIPQLRLFLSDPKNISPKIEYLITQYENFIKQQQDSIESTQPISNHFIKQTIFEKLEKILSEIVYIEDPTLREERIDSLYQWFMQKSETHHNLSQIKHVSEPSIYQRLTEAELNVNNREYQEQQELKFKEQHGSEAEHRTILNDYSKPSIILKNDYRCKHVTKKKSRSVSTHKEHSVATKNIIPQGNITTTDENNITTQQQQSSQQPQPSQQPQQTQQQFNISSSQIKPPSLSSIKDKDIFRSSIGMKSTFYSTAKTSLNAFMSTTLSSFSQLSSTNTKPFDSLKEIKSSYSFMRPDYSFNHLNIEKKTVSLKNQQLSEKRTQEEFLHKLNQYGAKRSEFKSNNQKRYDFMQIINIYQQQLKQQEPQEENDEQQINNLKGYFTKHKRLKHSFSSVNIAFKSDTEKDEFLKAHQIISSNSKRKGTTVNNEEDNINNTNEQDKVFTNNIRNINYDKKINENKAEKVFTYKLLMEQYEEKENICKSKIKEDDGDDMIMMHSDLVNKARQLDNKLNIRLLHSKMNSFSVVSNIKETYHENPLSAYSLNNYKSFYNKRFLFENNRNEYIKEDNNNLEGSSFIKKNFDFNNYLKMRNTLSHFNKIEVRKLKASHSCANIRRNTMRNNSEIQHDLHHRRNRKRSTDRKLDEPTSYNSVSYNTKSIEDAFIMPDVRTFYPKFFLPRSSSGLLKTPADMLKGAKKKEKKLKKK